MDNVIVSKNLFSLIILKTKAYHRSNLSVTCVSLFCTNPTFEISHTTQCYSPQRLAPSATLPYVTQITL